MEDDEDDFYGSGDPNSQNNTHATQYGDSEMETRDDHAGGQDGDGDEEEESEEDEDDVEFTLEKPEGAKADPPRQARKSTPAPAADRPSSTAQLHDQQNQPPSTIRPSSTAPQTHSGGPGTTLTYNGKPGSDFPAPHTSTLDINAIPIWPGTGKPLTSLDIDADLAEHTKPWRLPGTDQTDYFNYGFDEYAWAAYCIRQQSMRKDIAENAEADSRLKAMFGGPGAGAGAPGGIPGGMGGGGGMNVPNGMPDPEQLMQQMMAQGMNPADMNFEQFMAMAGGPMGGGGPPNGPAAMSGGFPPNSISPANNSGFAPPQGGQGGMGGYSAQQMAMMQDGSGAPQGPGSMMGGGRGGRGGRRGRGYY
ncbi:Hypothetical protein R9X50_00740300 [Acrodontium crateriforme]|uniref:Pre-mRNA polyadenylation factor Fip1 domain-containing protein n=1 Tax=Acrodontium crateriforme TaxID=150365 RepID=A0AAQ3MCX0_9PEZI|nr:Hypothetical protein R9X50_00740300 [Acrodontium crateriforme]